ncbi:MAG: LytR C-terminal domain-containing protein [Cyanobacteria bacterium P01_A01_bin.40]
MNQERSRRGKNQPLHFKDSEIARQKSQAKLNQALEATQNPEQLSNSSQITPLHQPLWFWSQHSSWSYFNRGFFWGGMISLTAVCSAIGGVALTRITPIEQAIVQRIDSNHVTPESETQSTVNNPVNVLLLEVKSDADDIIEFSEAFLGESKTVLLLKLQPQLDSAQVIYIPNNSSVTIPEFGTGTIEDAYKIGGMKLLSEVITQLVADTTIEHYVRGTSEVFQQLFASGKITLEDCDVSIRNCANQTEQVMRQQVLFNTIRQRLNIPGYYASFQTTITKLESDLDADISVEEIVSWANFIKELEPDKIDVDLLPGYTPGKALPQQNLADKSSSIKQKKKLLTFTDTAITSSHPFQYSPIAVQNTTDNHELGIQVVAYLRHRNFRDVYLVRHSPLKLSQTRIVANQSQIDTASYLKNILGFGNLHTKSDSSNRELTLQVGEDALDLPINYRSYNH